MFHKLNILTKKQKGDGAELLALDYLKQHGLVYRRHNYSCRTGEVDLIMYDKERSNTVFVEVRFRKNNDFGGAASSVTPKKQQKIIKTAQHYMQQHDPDASARFDVVAIEGDITGKKKINWIVDAFQ